MVTATESKKVMGKAVSQKKALLLKEAKALLTSGKITQTDFDGYKIGLNKAAKAGNELVAFVVPTVIPTPEYSSLNVGNGIIERNMAKVDTIASRVKMVQFDKTDERNILTVTTVKFDETAMNGKNIPLVVRIRTYTLYKDGRTSMSDSMLAGRGFASLMTPEMPYIDLDHNDPLMRFTYTSTINATKRLENARRVVSEQARNGLKMMGHDETQCENVKTFLKTFAKTTIKKTNSGMSDAEIEAKAKAQAEMLAMQDDK